MTLTAWMPESLNTGATPFEGLLPVEYIGHYYDGGDGVLLGATEVDFLQIDVIFEASFIRERFGYSADPSDGSFVRTLTIDLVQPEVFGVLLLDSFTPPAVANEFFEFPAYTQLACVGGEDGIVPTFDACADGAVVLFADFDGTPTSYTEDP